MNDDIDKMVINDEIEELNREIGALEYEIMLRKKEKHQLVMKKAQIILLEMINK